MTQQQKLKLFTRNTNLVILRGVTREFIQDDSSVATEIVTDAALTGTLYDGDGEEVAGAAAISFVSAGSPPIGDYAGMIGGSEFEPTPGGGYILTVKGSGGSGDLEIDYLVEILDRRE